MPSAASATTWMPASISSSLTVARSAWLSSTMAARGPGAEPPDDQGNGAVGVGGPAAWAPVGTIRMGCISAARNGRDGPLPTQDSLELAYTVPLALTVHNGHARHAHWRDGSMIGVRSGHIRRTEHGGQMAQTVSRGRRGEIERTARMIRERMREQGRRPHEIVAAIITELPEVFELEAWRFALGWNRQEVAKG